MTWKNVIYIQGRINFEKSDFFHVKCSHNQSMYRSVSFGPLLNNYFCLFFGPYHYCFREISKISSISALSIVEKFFKIVFSGIFVYKKFALSVSLISKIMPTEKKVTMKLHLSGRLNFLCCKFWDFVVFFLDNYKIRRKSIFDRYFFLVSLDIVDLKHIKFMIK